MQTRHRRGGRDAEICIPLVHAIIFLDVIFDRLIANTTEGKKRKKETYTSATFTDETTYPSNLALGRMREKVLSVGFRSVDRPEVTVADTQSGLVVVSHYVREGCGRAQEISRQHLVYALLVYRDDDSNRSDCNYLSATFFTFSSNSACIPSSSSKYNTDETTREMVTVINRYRE